MTITKKDFMENIKIGYRDHRQNPEENKKLDKELGKRYLKHMYFAGVPTLKEFCWLFHEGLEEFPEINFLDGDRKRLILAHLWLSKKGCKNSVSIYVDSTGAIDVITRGGGTHYKGKNCKDLLRIGKIIKGDVIRE